MNRPLTLVEMIFETISNNKDRFFTSREIAEHITNTYPEVFTEKRLNPKYNTETKFIGQVTAEVGSNKNTILRRYPNIIIRDRPRPRVFYWSDTPELEYQKIQQEESEIRNNTISKSDSISDIRTGVTDVSANTSENSTLQNKPTFKQQPSQNLSLQAHSQAVASNPLRQSQEQSKPKNYSEHDLYPMLIEFLHEVHGLYCQRIDEKTSRNSYGNGGNRWLHPDIVALEPLDQHWKQVVKECVRHGNDSSIRLWSFEVKKQLTQGNVRQSFFQAVSNSTWANFGYLVATGLGKDVEQELRMLASLHGIGVLILNTESILNSVILIPARERPNVDWQSVNRIASENSDYHNFVEQVGIYSQTGRLVRGVWNK